VLGDLFALNRADIVGSCRPRHEQVRLVEEFESPVEHVMTEAPPLSRHDLAVSGYDLMRIGIPPSEQLGKIQNALLQEVLDNPRRNNRDYLLSKARELMTTA
jgi:tRNA nucleotidyltransferase (CCA-adding enzyme)